MQKCVFFGFLESNCSLTLLMKKIYFCFHLHMIFFVYLCNQRHHGKSALSITFWLCLFFFLFLLPYYSRSFKSSNGDLCFFQFMRIFPFLWGVAREQFFFTKKLIGFRDEINQKGQQFHLSQSDLWVIGFPVF